MIHQNGDDQFLIGSSILLLDHFLVHFGEVIVLDLAFSYVQPNRLIKVDHLNELKAIHKLTN
jgi:hypothetical protein